MSLIYGVIVGQVFYSNRIEKKIKQPFSNGIYSMDMSADDFLSTIIPANIEDARKFFSKASKVQLIRGISFHDGIIPDNPVKYSKIPIKVEDPTYDEFEEVEVAMLQNKICYFMQVIYGGRSYALMDVKNAFDSKLNKLDGIKDVTPEMRVVYAFHLMERKSKELLEPTNAIKAAMAEGGAIVKSIRKTNVGFEVIWSLGQWTINTALDKNYRVMEAGFCVSNWDRTQSARSLVHVLDAYITEGSHVNLTRTTT